MWIGCGLLLLGWFLLAGIVKSMRCSGFDRLANLNEFLFRLSVNFVCCWSRQSSTEVISSQSLCSNYLWGEIRPKNGFRQEQRHKIKMHCQCQSNPCGGNGNKFKRFIFQAIYQCNGKREYVCNIRWNYKRKRVKGRLWNWISWLI